MTTFDEVLIERFYSPIAGRLKHHFGICQWRASLTCLDGSIAFYLGGVALTIGGKGMADGIFIDLLGALGWLAVMSFVRGVACRQAGSSIGTQSARFQEWLFRTVLIAMVPLSLIHVRGLTSFCFSVSLLFLVSHLYLKASDTPPPQQKRKFAFSRG
jgi:hypothetical protein